MTPAPPDSVRWMFLDLDSYFASCEQQARPDYQIQRERPGSEQSRQQRRDK